MKLAALHAGRDDDDAIAPLWAALSKAPPDRLVLLGAAGQWAARRAAAEAVVADDQFLDEVAAFLVEDRPGPPPQRRTPGLLGRATVIGPQARALELFGPFVCIVQQGDVAEEELESAHLWIVPAAQSGVSRRDARIVLRVGDPACVLVEGADPTATLLDASGQIKERVPLALTAATKMVVQGSTR